MDSRWADIMRHLKSKGYDVYPPSTKRGECKKKYLVVLYQGKSEAMSVSSNIALYDILLYVPREQYSTIEDEMRNIESSMDELFPLFRPMHIETPPFYDSEVKGWMTSVQYCNYQKKVRY